jgi:two-component system OmpR family response regulator
MATRHILIAEDNRDLAFGLSSAFTFEGFGVTVVHAGDEVLATLEQSRSDLLLLNLTLPVISGFEILERLRAYDVLTPVVVLSARDGETARVAAFRSGADDYVAKPFSLLELIERVRARLRSAEMRKAGTQVPELILHLPRGQIQIGREFVRLTPKELALLQALLVSAGTALSKEILLARVWRSPPINTRTVEFHIASLRRKLAPFELDRRIVTVTRVGFMWDDTPADRDL